MKQYNTTNKAKNTQEPTKKVWSIAVIMYRASMYLLLISTGSLVTQLPYSIIQVIISGDRTMHQWEQQWFHWSFLLIVCSLILGLITNYKETWRRIMVLLHGE